MEVQMVPGDWTDVCNLLRKCQQSATMIFPDKPWKDSYQVVEGKNGTIVFRFSGLNIKEISVSTKSIAELEKELGA